MALVGFWKDPFDGDSPRLYPIVREEDYEDGSQFSYLNLILFLANPNSFLIVARDDVLSDGEKVMVAVFGGLYGLVSLIFPWKVSCVTPVSPTISHFFLLFFPRIGFPYLPRFDLPTFHQTSFPYQHNSVLLRVFGVYFPLCLPFYVCCWLDFLHFSVFIVITISDIFFSGYFREEDAGSFVLVEPPSFFIITIASTILMSLGFTLYCLANHVQQVLSFFKITTI